MRVSSLTKRCRDRCIRSSGALQPARAVGAVVTSKRDIRVRAKLHGTTGNRGSSVRHGPARPAADCVAPPWDGRHELSHVIRTANRVEGFRVLFAPRQIEQLDQLIPIQCHRSAPSALRIVAVGPSTTLRAGTRPRAESFSFWSASSSRRSSAPSRASSEGGESAPLRVCHGAGPTDVKRARELARNWSAATKSQFTD